MPTSAQMEQLTENAPKPESIVISEARQILTTLTKMSHTRANTENDSQSSAGSPETPPPELPKPLDTNRAAKFFEKDIEETAAKDVNTVIGSGNGEKSNGSRLVLDPNVDSADLLNQFGKKYDPVTGKLVGATQTVQPESPKQLDPVKVAELNAHLDEVQQKYTDLAERT